MNSFIRIFFFFRALLLNHLNCVHIDRKIRQSLWCFPISIARCLLLLIAQPVLSMRQAFTQTKTGYNWFSKRGAFYFISLIITFSVGTAYAADVIPPANPADAVIVGDRVFLDVNANGVQDKPVVPDLILGGPSSPGDPGFAFATIQLLNSSDQLLNETQSDVFGNFAFRTDSVGNLLPPDTYRLQFVLPAGMNYTTQGAGGDINRH